MRLYIVSNTEKGTDNIDGIYELVTEKGEFLYSHWCSNKSYARGDLIENRPNRIEECKKRFGDYEVIFLGEDEMTIDKLWEQWRDNNKREEK